MPSPAAALLSHSCLGIAKPFSVGSVGVDSDINLWLCDVLSNRGWILLARGFLCKGTLRKTRNAVSIWGFLSKLQIF